MGKVNFLKRYPMRFFECLQAVSKKNLYQHLTNIKSHTQLEDSIHADLCDLLKLYLFVDGMPEALKTYIKTQKAKTNLITILHTTPPQSAI